jgi:hypothetical protein
MSTWPNRGASGGPCGGLEEWKSEPKTVRPTRSDSSQQASSKPGAVHFAVLDLCCQLPRRKRAIVIFVATAPTSTGRIHGKKLIGPAQVLPTSRPMPKTRKAV